MIPLRDNIPSASRPYASYAIIGANVLIFLLELARLCLFGLLVRLAVFPGRFFHLRGGRRGGRRGLVGAPGRLYGRRGLDPSFGPGPV